jgi:hypothetical protein
MIVTMCVAERDDARAIETQEIYQSQAYHRPYLQHPVDCIICDQGSFSLVVVEAKQAEGGGAIE